MKIVYSTIHNGEILTTRDTIQEAENDKVMFEITSSLPVTILPEFIFNISLN